MGPPKPMPFSPISKGIFFLFQDKKHDAVEYTNADLLCGKLASCIQYFKPNYITIGTSSLNIHIIGEYVFRSRTTDVLKKMYRPTGH
jgi:hypothetical protein